MEGLEFHSAHCHIDADALPVPELLSGKDVRADPIAKLAVLSASKLLEFFPEGEGRDKINVIVVSKEGCTSHVKRVSDGIAKRIPKQGFFARGGPQTMATYTALALSTHGAAFTLIGEEKCLDTAISIALAMCRKKEGGATLLTLISDCSPLNYKASSVLIMPEVTTSIDFKQAVESISQALRSKAN